MLTTSLAELRNLESRAVALAEHRHDGSAAAAFAGALDNLLPPELISTTECAIKNRVLPGPDGKPVKWNPDLTPYNIGIQDASDAEP